MRERGFIKLIIIIIIGVIILSVFNVNIRSIVNNKLVQENFSFLWDWIGDVWHDYLKRPAGLIWGVFYNNIWLIFVEKIGN